MSTETEEMLRNQIADLIRKLSEANVEKETLRIEKDLWKEKYEKLSRSKETLSSQPGTPKTKVPGSVVVSSSEDKKELEETSVAEAAIFIAKHPEMPWQTGKEEARKTIE